jgi:hypothetical protein
MKPNVIMTLLGLKGLTVGFCAIAVLLAQSLPGKPEVLIGAAAAGIVSACFGLATVIFIVDTRFGQRE